MAKGAIVSSISRRSVLGYTGTAAAGAVLSTAGPAQAAEAKTNTEAETGATAEQASATAVEFQSNPGFAGTAILGPINSAYLELDLSFSVAMNEVSTTDPKYFSALDIANLLNQYATSKGWPAITFYGTPVKQPLN